MGRSSNYDCPICGQYMDFISISYRNSPYIDGKCYKRMCFCCSHAPQEWVQEYDKDGEVINEHGPYFDHKHIKSPEEMVQEGCADNIEYARRCYRGIKKKIEEAGAVSLRKLKITRPKQEFELNPEFEAETLKQVKSQPKRKAKSRS